MNRVRLRETVFAGEVGDDMDAAAPHAPRTPVLTSAERAIVAAVLWLAMTPVVAIVTDRFGGGLAPAASVLGGTAAL